MLAEFESVAKRLQADFEETQAITHSGLKGDAREKAIAKEMLRRFLPKRYSVAGGVIVDSTGQYSQQQDLVIYDAMSSPTLQDHEDNQVFFVEQVLATIEVKSSLDSAALTDIVQKAASVDALVSKPPARMQLAPGFMSRPSRCPSTSYGFAYTSLRDLYDICGILNERSEITKLARRPSAILVLRDTKGRSGLVVNTKPSEPGTIVVVPDNECRFAVVITKTQGQALLHFYLILMERIQFEGVLPPRPDFQAYAAAAGLPRPMTAIMWKAAVHGEFLLDGKPADPDVMSSLMPRWIKILSQQAVTDEEIIEFFARFMSLPVGDSFPDNAFFVLDRRVWDEYTPAQVDAALAAWRDGTAEEVDKRTLTRYAALVREIVATSSRLYVFDPHSSSLLMCVSPNDPVRLNDEEHTLWRGTFRILGRLPDAMA